MKMFDGFLDSLYKKWELYLFRLFQLGKYIENYLRYSKINGPTFEDLLNIDGCDDQIVRIPPNPFYLRNNDIQLFSMFYTPLECHGEKDKAVKELLREIINRIACIKRFIGITRNTRYIGESDAEKRLCNEIDVYIKYQEACSSLHSVVLGDPNDVEVLKSFQRFLKDRNIIRNRRSFQQY